jgi:formylglycine-generating enzyme required for sulfatase activity
MEFVLVPPGSFQMGWEGEVMGEGDVPELKPVHLVTFARAFCIGKYEVTQRQWEAVMGSNPSHFKGGDLPAVNVSWDACQAFVRKLSRRTGRKHSLPSEAEWEYACRAGGTAQYFFGDGVRELGEYAWFDANSSGTPHPVGQKKPNAWGLFDMDGNVWEWCEDVYHRDYTGAPADGSAWMRGRSHPRRVMRGGAWDLHAWSPSSAARAWADRNGDWSNLGVRVVLRER